MPASPASGPAFGQIDMVETRASARVVVTINAFGARLGDNEAQIAATATRITNLVEAWKAEESARANAPPAPDRLFPAPPSGRDFLDQRNRRRAIVHHLHLYDALLQFRRDTINEFRSWVDSSTRDLNLVHIDTLLRAEDLASEGERYLEERVEARKGNAEWCSFLAAGLE
ncbi:uncharacterized protein AB675_10297 [Cyphellophora attinorum]|uniref:Uncharacterized protein n=1 Tax=Cyphellophora attinorum TaxID=1664694 RepID=A0A0N0NJU7_9EURO|nr:uncharacterized protein AB675_10297 [Phialophora attinorum]KPI37391.1 hypothetical protein AB675_10297 [Phialophora attinorum]